MAPVMTNTASVLDLERGGGSFTRRRGATIPVTVAPRLIASSKRHPRHLLIFLHDTD